MGIKFLFSTMAGLGLAAVVSGCGDLDKTMTSDEWREVVMDSHLTDFDKERGYDAYFHDCVEVQGSEHSYLLKSWNADVLLVERYDSAYEGYCLSGMDADGYTAALDDVEMILEQVQASDNNVAGLSFEGEDAIAALEDARLIYNAIQENEISGLAGDESERLIGAASVFYEQAQRNKNIARLEAFRADGTLENVIERYKALRPQAEVVERCAEDNDLYASVDTAFLPAVRFSYWHGGSACKGSKEGYNHSFGLRRIIIPAFGL